MADEEGEEGEDKGSAVDGWDEVEGGESGRVEGDERGGARAEAADAVVDVEGPGELGDCCEECVAELLRRYYSPGE